MEATIRQALASAGRESSEIIAVSYSSQANTFAIFDAAMKPLTPFVVWSDRRVSQRPSAVQRLLDEHDLLDATGLGLFSDEMCPVKLLWFREHYPELWNRGRIVMTISDFAAYLFTGDRVGDASTASLTGIWELRAGRYWQEGLDTLDLPAAMFSQLFRPGSELGVAVGPLSWRLGLSDNARVAAGAIDHYAAAIGVGVGSLCDASESTGTVLAVVATTSDYTPQPGAGLGPALTPGQYYRLSFTNNGAKSVEWYQQTHAPELSLRELTAQAAEVVPGSGGVVAKSEPWTYSGLEGFRVTATDRGVPRGGAVSSRNAFDSEGGASHGHYFRAILEGVAYSLRELLTSEDGSTSIDSLIGTGGGARNDLWLQIKADVLGVRVLRTAAVEPAAYGAAILAAGVSDWAGTVSELAAGWQKIEADFEPDVNRAKTYQELCCAS
jgi:xylulokinase